MADKTGISWTEATWNPVTGCSKVSEGCRNCYAERVWPRLAASPGRYFGRTFTDIRIHEEVLLQPLRWKRPRRIFVNSMSDLFHPDVPDTFIAQVFAVMAIARGHTFQILTKRPERLLAFLSRRGYRDPLTGDVEDDEGWGPGSYASWMVRDALESLPDEREEFYELTLPESAWDLPGDPVSFHFPLDNVWFGVSVEDQKTADERIPILLQVPAARRWVSVEPMIGPVNFEEVPAGMFGPLRPHRGAGPETPKLDWIVCGGESGTHARPMGHDWARSLWNQCREAGVPFFMKQLSQASGPGFRKFESFPEDLRIREYPTSKEEVE